MVLGILSGKPDSPDSQEKKEEEKMFEDWVSGSLGILASFGGFGGIAFVVASLIPSVAIAGGALVIVAGAHTWLTRKK